MKSLGKWYSDYKVERAKKTLEKYNPKATTPEAFYYDPLVYLDSSDYKENPSPIVYDWLRNIERNDVLVTVCEQAILDRLSDFAVRPRSRFDIGTVVRTKDPSYKPTAADKKEMAELTKIIFRENLGPGVPTLEAFYKTIIRDVLRYDQGNAEIVFEKGGKKRPMGFFEVDAATMRLANDQIRKDGYDYVQVYDKRALMAFKFNEMAWLMLNPRNEVKSYGYGMSKIEQLIHTITSHLNAEQYNRAIFTQGVLNKGMLVIREPMTRDKLNEFKSHWQHMVTGWENSWRTPVFAFKDGVDWVSMQANNKDMEYEQYMQYHIRMICSIYQIDPALINWSFGNAGQASAMGQDDSDAKRRYSRVEALRPIIRLLETFFSTYIVEPRYDWDSPFEVAIVGLDGESEKSAFDRLMQEVKSIKTIDEARAELDMKPMPAERGQCILDNVWIQWIQTQRAAQSEQQQAQDGPGAGGDETGADGNQTDDQEADADTVQVEQAEEPEPEIKKSMTPEQIQQRTTPHVYDGWEPEKFKQPVLNHLADQAEKYWDETWDRMTKEIIEVLNGHSRNQR